MNKILISLPKELVEDMDRAKRLEHRSRSGIIREAIQRHLHHSGMRHVPRFLDPTVRRALAVQETIGQQLKGRWDSAQEIRRWRNSRRR